MLLREIKNDLIGLYVDDILFLGRLIQIVCGRKSLFISLYPEAPAIFFSQKKKQGFTRLTLFSTDLQSSRIIKVEQNDFMPVITLQLEKTSLDKKKAGIIITLYREAPNIIVKTPSVQKKLYKRYIQKSPKRAITALTEQQLSSLHNQGDSFKEQLVKEIEGVDKYLAGELTIENLQKLKCLLSGKKISPRLISVSPLRISFFASKYIKEYSSLNKLLEDAITNFIKTKAEVYAQSRKKELIRNLKKRIEKLKKKLLDDEEIEKHRIIGEIILTNITKIKCGSEKIKLFNPYTQKDMDFNLNPAKTPQQNAQMYFSKYKKLKRGQPKMRTKIADIRKQIEDITAEPLKQYDSLPHTKPTPKEKPLPYRSFYLPTGSVVYVGKNARSNAELTFQFARPNDYFFHVRGYGGAHTVLKARAPKGQKPRKEDIEAAAAIAAYFSKAKKQKNVAVSYTQRKYLKKAKKGKPGSVILMREEVIFAEPQLPSQGGPPRP